MQVNPLIVPALIGTAALFLLGATIERRLSSRESRIGLWILGLILAAPGFLFTLYYTHLFDRAAWYYDLRIVPYTELAVSGLGFLAGVSHSWWAPEGFGEKAAAPALVLVL